MKKLTVTITIILAITTLSISSVAEVTGAGLNQDYTKPTKDQIQRESVKFTQARNYVSSKELKSSSFIQPLFLIPLHLFFIQPHI